MEWQDVSTHDHRDKIKLPNAYALQIGKLRLYVHRLKGCYSDKWLMSCRPFYDCKVIEHPNVEDCKKYAIDRMLQDIGDVRQDLEKA